MVEAFIDFSSKPTIMITSRNNIVLYDSLPLDNQFLNKLYEIFAASEPSSVLVVTHAVYSKDKFKNAYEVKNLRVRGSDYTGTVSQLDINKLMYVFNALKIENIRFCDKFSMYEHYLGNNQCGVDVCCGKYLLLNKIDVIDKIDYVSSTNFELALLQMCRKNGNSDVINFANFTDYDAVKWFENFVKVADTSAYVIMTVFGFFKFIKPNISIDLTQVKFNSQLETVTYDTNLNLGKDKVLKVEEPIILDTIKAPDKKEISFSKWGLCIVNILIILLLVSALGLNYYFTKKTTAPSEKLAMLRNQNTHNTIVLDKMNEEFISNKSTLIEEIKLRCPAECVIASIMIDSSIEIVYYVPDTQTIDNVLAGTQDLLKVNGTSDGGVVTMNNINYHKYTVSFSE